MDLSQFIKSLTQNGCSMDGTLGVNNPLSQMVNQAINNGILTRNDASVFSKRVSDAACGKIMLNAYDEVIFDKISKGMNQGMFQGMDEGLYAQMSHKKTMDQTWNETSRRNQETMDQTWNETSRRNQEKMIETNQKESRKERINKIEQKVINIKEKIKKMKQNELEAELEAEQELENNIDFNKLQQLVENEEVAIYYLKNLNKSVVNIKENDQKDLTEYRELVWSFINLFYEVIFLVSNFKNDENVKILLKLLPTFGRKFEEFSETSPFYNHHFKILQKKINEIIREEEIKKEKKELENDFDETINNINEGMNLYKHLTTLFERAGTDHNEEYFFYFLRKLVENVNSEYKSDIIQFLLSRYFEEASSITLSPKDINYLHQQLSHTSTKSRLFSRKLKKKKSSKKLKKKKSHKKKSHKKKFKQIY